MKKTYIITMIIVSAIVSTGFISPDQLKNDNRIVIADSDNIEILSQVVDSAKDELDGGVEVLWMRDKKSGKETKVLQTVADGPCSWYVPDGKKFVSVPFDSIPVVQQVFVINENPLHLILEGCTDMRNQYSYYVDVPSHKAWWVPSNSGFLGETEEGFLVFHSYRYHKEGGRYTYIQVFSPDGNLIDYLDLKRHTK